MNDVQKIDYISILVATKIASLFFIWCYPLLIKVEKTNGNDDSQIAFKRTLKAFIFSFNLFSAFIKKNWYPSWFSELLNSFLPKNYWTKESHRLKKAKRLRRVENSAAWRKSISNFPPFKEKKIFSAVEKQHRHELIWCFLFLEIFLRKMILQLNYRIYWNRIWEK